MPPRIASLVLLGAFLFASASAAQPPNIVLILTDDQGYADVGCFGANAKDFTTPHLDRMAAEGRRFTNFHVAQAVCSASRAAILTGCYPNRIGLSGALGPRSKTGLHPDETTLAEVLKPLGYSTAIFGKWHLGDAPEFLPVRQGFDEYYGLAYSNDMWPRHPEARPGSYPPLPIYEGDRIAKEDLQPVDQEQLTTQYTERAVRFIEQHHSGPFFLYVAHNMPHVPLHVSDKFRGKSARGLYGDVIQEIDWSVGQILDALHRHSLDDNTLVIFTSDNGPWLSYGDHAGSALPLREGKGTAWEGGTRVPCIMRWPGHLPPNTSSGELLMSIDLLPTIAALTGAPLPRRPIDGLNVWPLLSGVPGAVNPHAGYLFYYNRNDLQAVASGDWKLVLPQTYRTLGETPRATGGIPAKYHAAKVHTPELYHLTSDPSEVHDVAMENPAVVARLLGLAEDARKDLGDESSQRVGAGVRSPGRLP